MLEFQRDWNNSVCTLLDDLAAAPPAFAYNPSMNSEIKVAMSDASPLYVPQTVECKGVAMIKVASESVKAVPWTFHRELSSRSATQRSTSMTAPIQLQRSRSKDSSNASAAS